MKSPIYGQHVEVKASRAARDGVQIGEPVIIAVIVSAVVAIAILTVNEFAIEPRRWHKNMSQQFRKMAADRR
jgi:hypothetical protein